MDKNDAQVYMGMGRALSVFSRIAKTELSMPGTLTEQVRNQLLSMEGNEYQKEEILKLLKMMDENAQNWVHSYKDITKVKGV